MGYNAMQNCTNNPAYLNLQYDTPFVDKSGYVSVIQSSFGMTPSFTNDDNSQALRAAVEKMRGTGPYTTFGTNLTNLTGARHNVQVVPRDQLDQGRTPIIVLISDFQMLEDSQALYNASGEGYWSQSMKRQGDAFAALPGNGILMTIRLDHSSNNNTNSRNFMTTTQDSMMQTYLSPAGRAGWSFTKIGSGVRPIEGFNQFKDVFTTGAPQPSTSYIVTDTIPEGLTVDTASISHGGSYNATTRTVTWDLTSQPPGTYTVSVTTTVAASTVDRNFNNKATITAGGGPTVDTNTTYHRLDGSPDTYTLYLRQVVMDYRADVDLPYIGFFTLENNGRSYNVTTDSNRNGVEVDFRSIAVPMTGVSRVYAVNNILPQYHDYDGFIVSTSYTVGSHNPAFRQSGPATANFASGNEIWMTVYIKPRFDPGKHSWGFETNDFRKIVLN
jgi:hypothetical protein